MEPRLLAFDTSTETLALALADGVRVHRHHEPGGARASARLLPAIDAMRRAAGLELRDLDAIAFGCGPGAFTGLRTSCAVAQGLAFGLGKPVLPIDSLLIVAEDARVRLGAGPAWPVCVAMDARMQEIYAARYHWDGAHWHTVQAPALLDATTWQSLHATLDEAVVGNGPGGDATGEGEVDRAGALLRLALRAWADGLAVGAEQALPLYLRDKVALTTEERAAARQARDARDLRGGAQQVPDGQEAREGPETQEAPATREAAR